MELFHFRFMQTDPNWANFLYNPATSKLGLIDFGASREYSKEFMDGWYRLIKSALEGNREVMKVESENLGYLTGEENEVRLIDSEHPHEDIYLFKTTIDQADIIDDDYRPPGLDGSSSK